MNAHAHSLDEYLMLPEDDETPLVLPACDEYCPLCDDTLPLDVALRLMERGWIIEGKW